jgi:hypothetical protein
MNKEQARIEAKRLLVALAEIGHAPAVRSLCEKRLSRVLRLAAPCRVTWRAGEPVVMPVVGPRAGDSMYGARRAAGYIRRVG